MKQIDLLRAIYRCPQPLDVTAENANAGLLLYNKGYVRIKYKRSCGNKYTLTTAGKEYMHWYTTAPDETKPAILQVFIDNCAHA